MIEISEKELAGKPGTEEVRKRMLMSAVVYYQGLMAQRGIYLPRTGFTQHRPRMPEGRREYRYQRDPTLKKKVTD